MEHRLALRNGMAVRYRGDRFPRWNHHPGSFGLEPIELCFRTLAGNPLRHRHHDICYPVQHFSGKETTFY